ncbi:MAG: 30S ribosomal protein S1 [Candidatus Omnitrophota bacterium]|nr:30S ribosomal protein S1 [Candidatus Omnitrophota bacterium]
MESKQQENKKMSEIYNQTLKDIKEGQIIKGTIVGITQKDVLVDVGYKSEGIIPLIEFSNPKELKLNQEIEVLVEAKEDEDGRIMLSREKAEKLKGWQRIVNNTKEGDLVEGRIKKKVKGGYIVDVYGTEGFLPISLSSFRGVSDSEIMSKSYKFQVTKMNKLRRSLILSRRDAIQKEREETKGKLWDELKVGQKRIGLIKSITDFGAFIDLGGIDGLLHITDMSWSRISHPSEVVAIGDKIEVVVLDFDKKNAKISLGLKQVTLDPWQDIENKFPVGSKVKGKVVNILPYGIFVELDKGIEGLVHSSEISWQKKIVNLQEMFAIGDLVEVQVLNIDKEAKRISLSIRQLEANPWLEAESKFPIGSKVSGKVRGFTDYGAFMELDENLEGMIHVSDMSWTKRVAHPHDILRKGQKVEVIVLAVDAQNRKITLGLKQLITNPWPEIAQKYPIGTQIEAEVLQVSSFGVFVKLEAELEGLVYSGEISKEQQENLKPADKLMVRIIKVDVNEMKVGLSAKLT